MKTWNQLLNCEKRQINWSITKFEKKLLLDLPFFSYRINISGGLNSQIKLDEIDSSNILICGWGGCGKTNLAITISHFFNIKIYFGKHITNLDFLKNNDVVIIDAINEIENKEIFKKLICHLQSNQSTKFILTCRSNTDNYNEIIKIKNIRTFEIDWEQNYYDWNHIDFNKFDNQIKILSFMIIKKYLRNNRNIAFLYSCITSNSFYKTNNDGNIVSIIRDTIEQFFKKHKQSKLWNILKKSTEKQNLFLKLTKNQIDKLIGMGFIYKDNKFDIEEIFHKLVCNEPWENKNHNLFEYAQAYRNYCRNGTTKFKNFKNYCLFLSCHPNPKFAAYIETNNKNLINDDEIGYCLFFKSDSIEKLFLKNILSFLEFYKNFCKKTNFSNSLIVNCLEFNKENYLFLLAFILIKSDDLSSLALKKFLVYFDSQSKDEQNKIISNIKNLLSKLDMNNIGNDFVKHYIFTRFCLILRKINELIFNKNAQIKIFFDGKINLHSAEAVNNKYFSLRLKQNTYFASCFTHKIKQELNFKKQPYSLEELEFVNWFDRHHFHNQKLIDSPSIDWLSPNFEFWLNTEPLLKNIWKNTPIRIGFGYPIDNKGSHDSFSDDKFGYIIDVLLYNISQPRKKANPDICHFKQKGVYMQQDLLANIPYYMSHMSREYMFSSNEKFLPDFNNLNVITFQNLPLFERFKYSLSKIAKLISHRELISFNELYDSRMYNTYITLNYSNNNRDSHNLKYLFEDASKKYCYKHFETDENVQELIYNDKQARYYFDNIHRNIVLSKNKTKYKYFRWWLSLSDSTYWIDVTCINNELCIIEKSKHGAPSIKKKVPFNKLLKALNELLKN